MSTLERRTTIERLKYIASHSNPQDGFSIIPTADLEMLLAVVEAAQAQGAFCEGPTVTFLGIVPCNSCDTCRLRVALAALKENSVQ